MTNTNKKGFTLIEMLVVVAVISILSGLTLTGIGGFTSRARDTRRIGDVRNIQNYVETYFSRCGHYPGDGTCDPAAAPSNWADFQDIIDDAVSLKVPQDPVANRTYFYGHEPTRLQYIIGAQLENDHNSLDEAGEVDDTSGFTLVPSGASSTCDDGDRGYCISN